MLPSVQEQRASADVSPCPRFQQKHRRWQQPSFAHRYDKLPTKLSNPCCDRQCSDWPTPFPSTTALAPRRVQFEDMSLDQRFDSGCVKGVRALLLETTSGKHKVARPVLVAWPIPSERSH